MPTRTESSDSTPRDTRLGIASKFFVLLLILIPSSVAVAWIGDRALGSMKAHLDAVYEDNLRTASLMGRLGVDFEEGEELAFRLIGSLDDETRVAIRSELTGELIPGVTAHLAELRALGESDATRAEGELTDALEAIWRGFLRATESPAFLEAVESNRVKTDTSAGRTIEHIADTLRAQVGDLRAFELRQAERARLFGERTYARSRLALGLAIALGSAIGVGATVWLVRNVVPRVRDYSRFASRVAAGDLGSPILPRGRDELTELGWALNHMVESGQAARRYEET